MMAAGKTRFTFWKRSDSRTVNWASGEGRLDKRELEPPEGTERTSGKSRRKAFEFLKNILDRTE